MHFFFIKHKRKGLDNNNSILALKICILFIPIKELCVCDIEDITTSKSNDTKKIFLNIFKN
jgi:hypothetical protein